MSSVLSAGASRPWSEVNDRMTTQAISVDGCFISGNGRIVAGRALDTKQNGASIPKPHVVSDSRVQPRMNTARLTPQPKSITAKNAENAENEWLLYAVFAFFAVKIRARRQDFHG